MIVFFLDNDHQWRISPLSKFQVMPVLLCRGRLMQAPCSDHLSSPRGIGGILRTNANATETLQILSIGHVREARTCAGMTWVVLPRKQIGEAP